MAILAHDTDAAAMPVRIGCHRFSNALPLGNGFEVAVQIESAVIAFGNAVLYVEKILGHHRHVVLKIGISIDGIGAQHDSIRGLASGYDNALETARLLKGLKSKYSNLLVFAVTTVNGANVHQLESIQAELSRTGLFDDQFLTLVRGPSSDTQLVGDEFELYRHAYLKLTAGKKSSASVKEAVNKAINALAFQELVKSRNTGSNSFRCLAGEKMINVSEQGDVCICEMHSNPLLGNLRDHGYDVQRILQLPDSVRRLSAIGKNSCNCHWDCAIFCSLLFGGVFGYKKIVSTLVKGKKSYSG